VDGPLLTETPAGPSPELRPLARPSRVVRRALGVGGALAVLALLGSLAWALGADADGANPGATRIGSEDAVLAVGASEEFGGPEGAPPGRAGDIGATWDHEGGLRTRRSTLVAEGAGRATLPLPDADRVVQVVLRRPAAGWTVAFGVDGVDRWAVRIGLDAAVVVRDPGGDEEVLATAPLGARRSVEVLATRRGDRVEVAVGPFVAWGSSDPADVATDTLALEAVEGAGGGVDLVSVREL
jgi:hypothetical protein